MNKPQSAVSGTSENTSGFMVATDEETRVNFDTITNEDEVVELIKEHGAKLSFPEKLMLLMMYVDMECAKGETRSEVACITWTNNGTAFTIRNQQELLNRLLPLVFQKGKFSSFTRKLYRWGFRQVLSKSKKGVTADIGTKTFFHKCFQRDNKALLSKMHSMTTEAMKPVIKSAVVETASASLYSRHRDVSGVGSTSLSSLLLPSEPPRQEVSLSSLLGQSSISSLLGQSSVQESRQQAQADAGLASWINPSFLAGQGTHLAAPLFPSTVAGSAFLAANLPVIPPLWTYSLETSIPPMIRHAAALQIQQQHAHDVARARQHLAAIADQEIFTSWLLRQNQTRADVEDHQATSKRQEGGSAKWDR